MKYRTLDEIAPIAQVVPVQPESPRVVRRKRLEHLAAVLEAYEGPFRLFSRVEYFHKQDRPSLHEDHSPLWVAYRDPVLLRQGLASDRMGDAMAFFDLSWSEAHHLFCDCHYTGSISARRVAERVRSVAARVSLAERWESLRNTLTPWFGRTIAIGR
jgi:hypothetical protein